MAESGRTEDTQKQKQRDTDSKSSSKRSRDEMESESYDEYYAFKQQTDVPDRSKSDYYCDLCDSHMNSEDMWESHIAGRRHIRNTKKEPGEPPAKIRTVKSDIPARITRNLNRVDEPIVGLDYLCEIQRSDPLISPMYTCYLCHASCTAISIVDHLVSTKHRLAYLKVEEPATHSMIESMNLKKSSLDSLVTEHSMRMEKDKGRGEIEVKLEKSKPSIVGSHTSNSSASKDIAEDSEQANQINVRRARDTYEMILQNAKYFNIDTKLRILEELSTTTIPNAAAARVVMHVYNSLSQTLKQYKIRCLPMDLQMRMAREILNMDANSDYNFGERNSSISGFRGNIGSDPSNYNPSNLMQEAFMRADRKPELLRRMNDYIDSFMSRGPASLEDRMTPRGQAPYSRDKASYGFDLPSSYSNNFRNMGSLLGEPFRDMGPRPGEPFRDMGPRLGESRSFMSSRRWP